MIRRIVKIKSCPSFLDFKPSADLQEFARYNLIYGWNGTGKTSFSRILRSFELGVNYFDHPERWPEFELKLNNGLSVKHTDLTSFKNIRVFNKDFVEDSVFGSRGPKPIFFLGKQSKEGKKRIDDLQTELKDLQEKADSKKTELEAMQKERDKKLQVEAKDIKSALTTTKQDHYRNYNRSYLEKSIRNHAHKLANAEQLKLSAERLAELNRSIQQTSKAIISTLPLPNFELSEIERQVNGILSATLVSQIIEELQKDKDVNKWVEHGLQIHKSKSLEVCAFCDQRIPAHRLEELEGHFNDAYQRMIESVRGLKKACESRRVEITFPESSSFYEEYVSEYQEEKDKTQQNIRLFNKSIDSLVYALEQKEQNPFSTPLLERITPLEVDSFRRINEIIRRHNQKTNDFEHQIDEDKRDLELHHIADFFPMYDKQRKNIEEIQAEHQRTKTTIEEKEDEREGFRAQLVSHHIPAKQINDDLEAFLGRSDIQLQATEAREGYRITRGGEIANNLSEGEKTALAIVYFLAKINEEGFDLKNGVVVIDDPVSSLDSNAIFQAFSFVKESIKEASQIFILTHHFDFFRQVKNWFSFCPKTERRYFMTVCRRESLQRNSAIVEIDKLLLDYESEYHFLFNVLYKLAEEHDHNLEKIYPIPNVARKFLESFLAFRVPLGLRVTNIHERLKRIENFDEKKKDRIRRFVETHSHPRYESGIQDFDMSLLGEASDIVNDMIDLIKQEDPKHYAFLVESVTGQRPLM
jgi:wobble nucleotide-excising tRNase